MKRLSIKLSLALMLAAVLFGGCNKESYIESIGYVMFESESATDVGYFIFTSKGAATKCGKLTIYIDEKPVGELKSDYNGTINAKTEPVEGKIIKVVATSGSHSIRVKYWGNCGRDAKATYTLQKGKTMWYYIS